MKDGYNLYAKDVEVVLHVGQKFYNSMDFTVPPLNQSQVTITYKDIFTAKFTSRLQSSTNANEFPTTQEILILPHL